MKVHVHFKFARVLKLFKIQIFNVQCKLTQWTTHHLTPHGMDLLNVTEDSSPCNSTPMNLLSASDRLRLETDDVYASLTL